MVQTLKTWKKYQTYIFAHVSDLFESQKYDRSLLKICYLGLQQSVRGHANFPFSCDGLRCMVASIRKVYFELSFGATKVMACANEIYVLACNQKYGNVYCIDISYMILFNINNYWYNLLDLTSSLVNENNVYFLIGKHMRPFRKCEIVCENHFRILWGTRVLRSRVITETGSFQIKILILFYISAQNIGCGYLLEPSQRGGSNEYQQSMLFSRNKKK